MPPAGSPGNAASATSSAWSSGSCRRDQPTERAAPGPAPTTTAPTAYAAGLGGLRRTARRLGEQGGIERLGERLGARAGGLLGARLGARPGGRLGARLGARLRAHSAAPPCRRPPPRRAVAADRRRPGRRGRAAGARPGRRRTPGATASRSSSVRPGGEQRGEHAGAALHQQPATPRVRQLGQHVRQVAAEQQRRGPPANTAAPGSRSRLRVSTTRTGDGGSPRETRSARRRSDRTSSRGSSARTVPAPTRIASQPARKLVHRVKIFRSGQDQSARRPVVERAVQRDRRAQQHVRSVRHAITVRVQALGGSARPGSGAGVGRCGVRFRTPEPASLDFG